MSVARSAHADQLAAELRDRRSFHADDQACDALDPCRRCAADREVVRLARAQARIPQQRAAAE